MTTFRFHQALSSLHSVLIGILIPLVAQNISQQNYDAAVLQIIAIVLNFVAAQMQKSTSEDKMFHSIYDFMYQKDYLNKEKLANDLEDDT